MVYYKTSISDADPAFRALVLFTECAAGVAVFAQALLRRVNQEAADKAFKISILVRVLLALVGVALFAEGSTLVFQEVNGEKIWTAPFLSPGRVAFSHFLTYEIGNGLLLLIEWMFSHLLAWEDSDARVDLETANEELDKVRGEVKDLKEELDGVKTELDVLGDKLEIKTDDLGKVVRETLTILASLRTESDKRREFLKLLVKVAQGKAKESDPIPEELEAIVLPLREAVQLKGQLARYKGKTINVGPNKQEFICCGCGKSSKKDRKKKPICEHCGTDQSQPTETKKAV